MKVLRWDMLDSDESNHLLNTLFEGKKGTALTIGGFDGPHRGHSCLFQAVLAHAAHSNLVPGVVTFTRSPSATKKGTAYQGDVSTLNLRLAAFQRLGFEFALLIDFSENFGKITGGVFFDILVKTVHMRYVAVGPDFRCGHRLDTGLAEIEAFSRRDAFRLDSIRQVDQDGLRISSSSVRNAVYSADFTLAEQLLGHPFLLDFTAPEWTRHDTYFEAPIDSITQILPRRGKYAVMLDIGTSSGFPALFVVTEDSVSLHPEAGKELPPAGKILTVRFQVIMKTMIEKE